ncbi:hypothetical protein YC2023_107529 [Brassica napus]
MDSFKILLLMFLVKNLSFCFAAEVLIHMFFYNFEVTYITASLLGVPQQQHFSRLYFEAKHEVRLEQISLQNEVKSEKKWDWR